MKLYMAEGAFGGFKWQTDYYTLDNPDYRLIAANGLVSNTDPGAVRPATPPSARPPAAPTSAPSTGASPRSTRSSPT